jgi:hypothetical protein
MLLSTLTRKEKLKFLDLALHMVEVDTLASKDEVRFLNMMLAEVGENIVNEYQFVLSDNLEETILFFDVLSLRTRKIVYYNILKLAIINDFYNTKEHAFLEMIQIRFHLKDSDKKTMFKLLYLEKDLRTEINRVLGN